MIYLVFTFGLIAGSFLNVVICRLRSEDSIICGRSFCPYCKTTLKWHDLVPLLSFIYLRGRCRYCHKKISWQYPAVEILSGLIWLGIFYKNFNGNFQFLISNFQYLNIFYEIFILSALLVIAVYDFKWKIIPDKIVYPAVIAAILYNSFLALKFGDWQNYFLNPLLMAVVLFAFLFFIFYFSSGKAMGLGDAKLAFLVGLFLSPLSAAIAFTLAFIIGAVFGIILIGLGKKTLKSQIAFGPFLIFGTIIVFFLSDFINNFINFL
ncbi:MAG: prepilin peptidase [Candidatus Azambacteria bacterium]|nr:prepilin peptidase [Candidatus Azambacteria bacterium]